MTPASPASGKSVEAQVEALLTIKANSRQILILPRDFISVEVMCRI
jgi:hypothetical protein